jgi:uncharacterized membrane protein
MWTRIRLVFIGFAIILASGLLFVNVYNSLVDAPNWGSDIPTSIQAARNYFQVTTPGSFFRIFSPANQIVTLVALVLGWPLGWRARFIAIIALVTAVGADVFTFAYFYPRNEIMFVASPIPDNAALRAAWQGWSTVNWYRSGLVACNVALDCLLLTHAARSWADRRL